MKTPPPRPTMQSDAAREVMESRPEPETVWRGLVDLTETPDSPTTFATSATSSASSTPENSATSATSLQDEDSESSKVVQVALGTRVNDISHWLSSVKDGNYLEDNDFPPPRFAVEGLIPEGFTLLVGAPKAGKSYFVLGLALACASGGRVLSAIDVEPRDVLYLALEDGDARIKKRCRELDPNATIPSRFHYATSVVAGQVQPSIVAWLRSLDDPSHALVIIDTAQMIRPPSRPGANAYEADYLFGKHLKAIPDAFPGLALLVVHHTRKMKTADFVESSSGTNGFTGAADTVLLLDRERGTTSGTLHLTSREIAESEFALERAAFGWVLAGNDLAAAAHAAEASRSARGLGDVGRSIVEFVTTNPDASPTEIETGLGLDKATNVRSYLRRLVEDDRLMRSARGRYRLPDPYSEPMLAEIEHASDTACRTCGVPLSRDRAAYGKTTCVACEASDPSDLSGGSK